MIFEPVNGTASVANLPTVATRAAYHLRGQSSASFPQKPYKIEFRDNADADAKYAIAGMPADADWALIAPYYDRALIRNPFTYTLGREMGHEGAAPTSSRSTSTSPRGRRGDTDYQGIYWLARRSRTTRHRTNMKKLDATDTTEPAITGGYIFKFDQAATDADRAPPQRARRRRASPAGPTASSPIRIPLPLPTEQLAWITQYRAELPQHALHDPDRQLRQYIDVASFVDYLIISELTRNIDAYVRSAYFHKDRDGLLKGGPLWDYNFSLGVGGSSAITPTPGGTTDGGWQFQGRTAGSLPGRNVNSWFPS